MVASDKLSLSGALAVVLAMAAALGCATVTATYYPTGGETSATTRSTQRDAEEAPASAPAATSQVPSKYLPSTDPEPPKDISTSGGPAPINAAPCNPPFGDVTQDCNDCKCIDGKWVCTRTCLPDSTTNSKKNQEMPESYLH